MNRWTCNDFKFDMPTTCQVELSATTFEHDDKIIKVQYWDTGI